MSPVTAFSGVVLAAGRSTRMGRDKAMQELDGRPMWQRQREVLARSGATELFLSARPDQAWARAASGFHGLLHDAMPDCGPMAGITAALERATTGHVAVLAIDLPHMTEAWYGRLLAHGSEREGAVGRHTGAEGAYFEPLAAVYPRAIISLAWTALVAGDYSLQRLIAAAVNERLMRVVEIAAEERVLFANWNSGAATDVRGTD